MKKIAIIVAVAVGLMALGLIFVMVAVIKGGGSFHIFSDNGSFGEARLINTKNIKLDDIADIRMDYDSGDVVIYKGDTEHLVLKEYSTRNNDNKEAYIKEDGHSVVINFDSVSGNQFILFGFVNVKRYAELYVPSAYTGKLKIETSSGEILSDESVKVKDFEASTSSGDIELHEVIADKININSTSGEILIKNAAGDREISSSSGEIQVLGGEGDTSASSTSGSITIKHGKGHVSAESTSGEIDLEDHKGGGRFESSSGDTELEFSEVSDNITVSTSSGEIDISIPRESGMNFTAATSSGEISANEDLNISYNKKGNSASGTLGKNPTYDLDVTASSGDVSIYMR